MLSICWLVLTAFPAFAQAPVAPFILQRPPALPTCAASYGPSGVTTVGGTKTFAPKGNLYCLAEDGPWADKASSLLRQLMQLAIAVGPTTSVRMSADYYDGVLVAGWLCSLPGASLASLEIVVQRADTTLPNPDNHLAPEFLRKTLSCFNKVSIVSVGCDYYAPGAATNACPANQTNSHHIKGISIKGDRGTVYAFGTGNMTVSSLSRNVEFWMVGTAERPLPQFECLFDFSEALATHPDMKFWQEKAVYDACASFAAPLQDVQVVVLPFGEREFKDKVEQEFKKSKKVTMVGEFFESAWLFDLVAKYPEVETTFLVDSAYHYAAIGDETASFNFVTHASAARLMDFLKQHPSARVRYLQTNHHFAYHGQTNTVHARSILFESDVESSMMVGSAHWRDGAFRSNTEAQIFLSGEAAKVERQVMDDLISRSIVEAELPLNSTPAMIEN